MTMKKRNRAKCLLCGDMIESRFTHDRVFCKCGNLSVDGGKDYKRRTVKGNRDTYQEIPDELPNTIGECTPEQLNIIAALGYPRLAAMIKKMKMPKAATKPNQLARSPKKK